MVEANEIEVLEGLEAVRRRPAMYLGPLDDPLLATRLLLEAFCIARDEAAAGACTRVTIELGEKGKATVSDDGPGLPPDLAEKLMTQLFACRNQRRHVVRPETLCDHGLAVLNAVCESVELTVWSEGFRFTQSYAAGKPTTAFERHEATERHGTSISLALDRTILTSAEFSTEWLREWLGKHAGSLRFEVTDRRTGEAFFVGGSPQP